MTAPFLALFLAACASEPRSEPAPPPAPVEALPAAVVAPPALAPPFTERLLPWPAERTELTRAYWRAHYGEPPTDDRIEPHVVVLHWTGGSTAESAWQTFAPATLAGRAELQDAGALNVSAHFLVDRDGTTWQLVPTDRMARHVIGLNHTAIGIENVGDGERWPLTPAQVDANAALVRWLAQEHDITHLIGHHQYQRLAAHPYWQERDAGYRTVKVDPGDGFVEAVRARLEDLHLAEAPSD